MVCILDGWSVHIAHEWYKRGLFPKKNRIWRLFRCNQMPSTNRNVWFTPSVRIVKWATIYYRNHDEGGRLYLYIKECHINNLPSAHTPRTKEGLVSAQNMQIFRDWFYLGMTVIIGIVIAIIWSYHRLLIRPRETKASAEQKRFQIRLTKLITFLLTIWLFSDKLCLID